MQPYAKRVDMPLAVHGESGISVFPHRVVRGEHYGHFGGFVAVNGMNLALRQHEPHFLIGPNGAGKPRCWT